MSQLSSPSLLDLADVDRRGGLAVVALLPSNLWLLGHHGGNAELADPMGADPPTFSGRRDWVGNWWR